MAFALRPALAVLLALCAWAAGAAGPEPRELTDATFDAAIDGAATFVMFYAPSCSHCAEFAPTWAALAGTLGEIQVAKVDCASEAGAQTCARLDIAGYPTLKLIEDRTVYTYSGARDVEGLRTFALGGYQGTRGALLRKPFATASVDDPLVVPVTDANISDVERGEAPVLLEFYAPWCSHCRQLAPVYAELAQVLATAKPEVMVAKIDGTTSELALKRYGIRGFPTIMLLHKGRVWGYEGRRTVEGLQRFVEAPTNLVGAVPSDWRPWDEAAHALQSAWDDVQFVFSVKPAAAGLLVGAGVVTGCVLVVVLSVCLPYPKAPRRPGAQKQD